MLPVSGVVKDLLDRAGYWARHRSVLPFGIEPLWDIQRLSATHGLPIRSVFDVGAHTGQTASAMLAAFPDAAVHSFEPHPNSFNCLAEIRSERFRAHRLAMSDRCGEAEFFVYGEMTDPTAAVAASMNNSLVPRRQFGLVTGQYSKSIKVTRTTVDQFCADQGIDAVDFLKIDTEGHELEVLKGAQETLARRAVPFILLEFETMLPVADATGGALAPIAERLEPLGYRFMASYPVNMVDKPLYTAFDALFLRLPPSPNGGS